MDTFKTVKILQALANGVDPITGATIAEDSPIQRPQVIRALFSAIHQLEQGEPKPVAAPVLSNTSEFARSEKREKAWSISEDELLCDRFDEGILIGEMARLHNRTPGSVLTRLKRLGKVESHHLADVEAKRIPHSASAYDSIR